MYQEQTWYIDYRQYMSSMYQEQTWYINYC